MCGCSIAIACSKFLRNGSRKICICVLGVPIFAPFYDFDIWFWNCSVSVVFLFLFLFYYFNILHITTTVILHILFVWLKLCKYAKKYIVWLCVFYQCKTSDNDIVLSVTATIFFCSRRQVETPHYNMQLLVSFVYYQATS